MKRLRFVFIAVLLYGQMNAQLLNEIGVSVGGTNYSGDVGREFFIYPNRIGGSLMYKKNVNSRISYRTSYSYIPIYADDADAISKTRRTRGPNGNGYRFHNTIHQLSLGVEFNYFDYDVTSVYNGFSPYVFVEVAAILHNTVSNFDLDAHTYQYRKMVSYAIPFGIGYKSKITNALGYSLELRSDYTFTDQLDPNNDQFLGKFGNPNTNDWYFYTGISLTYSFGRPPCAVPVF